MFLLDTYPKRLLAAVLVSGSLLATTACDDDNDPPAPQTGATVSNFFAPSSNVVGGPPTATLPFRLFSFSAGADPADSVAFATASGSNWDLGFRGTTVIVNGGAAPGDALTPDRTSDAAVAVLENTTFENVTAVPAAGAFRTDADNGAGLAIPTGGGNGWYNYNPTLNLITPIPGKIYVFKLAGQNRYAKVEFLSYYLDAPNPPDPATDEARYYTFRYQLTAPGGTVFE